MNKFKLRLWKDSLLYSRKRKQTTKNIAVAALAILGSTIIAVLIATMFGYNPFDTIKALFSAAFVNEPDKLAFTLSVFALSAFAFSFAFKAGIFNIGISGQMYASGVAVLAFSNAIGNAMPNGLGQVLSLIIAMLVGSAVALLTGALERYFKVDAVVSAIILNWIILLIGFFIIAKFYPGNSELTKMTTSTDIPEHFALNTHNFPGWASSLIIVAIIAVILLVLTKYTVFGHKINATGLSLEGSKYAGYNVGAIKLSTFAISGAISGVLAVVLYTAYVPSIPATILNVVVPVEGFNGIAVGLIAGNNPIGIVVVSAVIGLFQTSSSYLPMDATFSNVIIGLLMLGASLTVVLHKYKPYIFSLKKRYTSCASGAYTEYENRLDSLISKYKSILSVFGNDTSNHGMQKKPIHKRLNIVYGKTLSSDEKDVLATLYLYPNATLEVLQEHVKGCDNLDTVVWKLVTEGYILMTRDEAGVQTYSINMNGRGANKMYTFYKKYNFIEHIVWDYERELATIKNEYHSNVIAEWMLLKLKPGKYVTLKEEEIANRYDSNLTKSASKKRNKIIANNDLIAKSERSSQPDAAYITGLQEKNAVLTSKIEDMVKQSNQAKAKDIEKAKTKLLKPFNVKAQIMDLNSDSITSFVAEDKRLQKINTKAIKLINKDVKCSNSQNELLTHLATYNNEIYKNGGVL